MVGSMSDLTIGQLARAAGVNVETIRYYQRIGLIEEPPRPAQGYRRYPRATVERIHFIKRAQELGFTLNEAAELMRLDIMDCAPARRLAEAKRREIQQRIDDLSAIRDTLTRLVERCRKPGPKPGCGIIESLADTRSDTGPATGSPGNKARVPAPSPKAGR